MRRSEANALASQVNKLAPEQLITLVGHYMEGLREAREVIRLYLGEYPVYRHPVGCPNSEVRMQQDTRILIENRAKELLEL